MSAPAPSRTYLEDVEVGYETRTPALTVTEAHAEIYRGLTRELADDPRTAPVLLPLCLAIGLGWRVPEPPLVVLAFMGLEWQVVRDVRVGDTISSRARVVAKRPMREGGVVIEEREILDQHGEVVQHGKLTFLVAKRPKEAAA